MSDPYPDPTPRSPGRRDHAYAGNRLEVAQDHPDDAEATSHEARLQICAVKSTIPLTGSHGIPLRDELVLVRPLVS
jgi:hypothetical protein